MISKASECNSQKITGGSPDGCLRALSADAGRVESRNLKKQAVASLAAALLALIFFLAGISPLPADSETDPRHAILLAGVSGDPDLQKIYWREIQKLHYILTGPLGFPNDQVTVLFDDPEMDPELVRYRSTRRGLEKAALALSKSVSRSDFVFVFIEGHGSFDGKTYKLNLVGPDPTAWELAEILYSIPAGRFVVVNATNCSGGSLQALSREGSIIITATKSGMESNQTHMGSYFIDSLGNSAADSNKDDRVSVLEAFIYAKKNVEDYYRNEGNLQTEHSVLEDSGDGQGQRDPTPENKEGLLARTTFFDWKSRPEASEALTADQQKLTLEARELEKEIEALKYRKEEMLPADYEKKLEELLLQLARINARLQN